MNQSKIESFFESCITVGIGTLVSLAAWPFIGALYGIPYSYSSHAGITAIFTVLALIRVYCVRRWFNSGIKDTARRLSFKFINWINDP